MTVATLGLFVALACTEISGLAPAAPTRTLVQGGTVVVYPGQMQGWVFQRSATNTTWCVLCQMVQGPGSPPVGTGSADIATGSGGFPPSAGLTGALVLKEYKGTRFDQITDLRYANYRWPVVEGPKPPTKLSFVADYDLNDQLTGDQGRIVFDPSQSGGFTVLDNTWQTWDAKAGKWWGTQATVQSGGQSVSNPCVSTAPCTWTQLLAAFPNLGVHSTLGAVAFEAPTAGSFGLHNNVDNLVIGVNGVTTTFDFETTNRSIVPMAAPDSVPAILWDSLTASANIITNPPGLTGNYIRDLVYVQFIDGATQTDRQSAIDAIHGIVVGGMTLGDPEHFYAVRLPYVLQPGDSASGPILRAIATLDANPKVAAAAPANMDPLGPTYRTPKDDATFGAWALSPDSADGLMWGPQAIDAPMAWGCSNGAVDAGQARPKIAVVDDGFQRASDLIPNVGTVQEYAAPSDTGVHGTAVAGIVAAVGNNNKGIAGMLWDAKLDLYDIARPLPKGVSGQNIALFNIRRAAMAGAQIINVSYAIKWPGPARPSTRGDSATARYAGKLFGRVIAGTRVASRPKTLFILAASNDTTDAYFGGLATAAAINPSYRTSMIVVGGIQKTSRGHFAIYDASSRGSLVDVAAPAGGVVSLQPFFPTGLGFYSGTSVAAPFVTGLAGMLMTFDSTLPVDSVRAYILAGADSGGRKVTDPSAPSRPLPIVNAYQSLRLAAQRRGGPLCGNRVWTSAGDLYALRDSAGAPDRLGPVQGNRKFYIDVYHGGKWIDYLYLNSSGSAFVNGHLQYNGSAWVTTASSDTTDLPGGSYSSSQGKSHDGGAAGIYSTSTDSAQIEHVTVHVSDTLGVEHSDSVSFPSGSGLLARRTWRVPLAYPQVGDSALVAMARMRSSPQVHTFPCQDDRGVDTTCTETLIVWVPDTTYLYSIKVRGSSPKLHFLRFLPDSMIYSLAFSEDDRFTSVALGNVTIVYGPNGGGVTQNWCEMRFLNSRAAGTPYRQFLTTDPCPITNDSDNIGTGGFSPNRIPTPANAPLKSRARRP